MAVTVLRCWSVLSTAGACDRPYSWGGHFRTRNICLLPLLRCHMRYRVSPSAIATDAAESGFGVVRSSTPTLEGSDELSLRALSTAVACDQQGIIELNAGIGGLRRAVELLERVPGVHAASEDDPAYYRVLETAWPTTVQLPHVAAVRSNHISQLVRSVSHILVWLIGGTIPIHSRLDRSSISRSPGEEDEFFRHFGRIASLVRSASTVRENCGNGRQRRITERQHGRHDL